MRSVGTGFWIAQLALLVAAIATAVYSERHMAQLDRGPLLGHLVPGVIANPGKYLAAV